MRAQLLRQSLLFILLLVGLSGCSSLSSRDPLHITLVGLEPLPSQGFEIRFRVKLRIQNPNAETLHYRGVALDLAINNLPLARGVSNQSGQVAGFSETLLSVPVTLSALSAIGQIMAAGNLTTRQGLPYQVQGKLAGGLFGSAHFNDSGTLNWPPVPPAR